MSERAPCGGKIASALLEMWSVQVGALWPTHGLKLQVWTSQEWYSSILYEIIHPPRFIHRGIFN